MARAGKASTTAARRAVRRRSRGKVTEHDKLPRSSMAVEPGGFQMPAILFIGVPVVLVVGGGLYFLLLR